MAGLWLLPAAVLLFFAVRERLRNRAYQREIAYIKGKLDDIAQAPSKQSTERILLTTESHAVRELLVGINDLLDRAGKSAADYAMTERAMRKMLANVSHDLRTPLTVVLGYAEMLAKNVNMTAEERLRLLEKVHRKTEEVLELMNAFFDLAKLESGDSELELSMVDAGEVCRNGVLAFYDLLSDQGLEVDIKLPEEPVWLYANEEALGRILNNLLSNAVRYGSDGGYLGLSLYAEGSEAVIEVTDRGRGIDAADQDRVFERLYTLDDSRNKHSQGSGLGLTITKRLAERMGGVIGVSSLPFVRTTFKLTMPRSAGARRGE
ncbi:sensor histidine kinase KdpD [Paenibacillus sp. PAMC21692]|jgi:signal transduction histidine kinase|uniref:sensor histidine kinase n=1 Tax=Paenibacillus sp. PAMC21692 TaxID=2762320 RepID=UPI00164E22CC|nr:sensor histidine kinase [Paenibacillus sp. PAMC21692]QNK58982.1 sensor histidine kinase [Paenibacillus sp. PAMC21692]